MSVKLNKIIHEKINTIKKSDSEEKIRVELFSIVTYIVLSKEIFPRNSNIKEFIEKVDDDFKNYKSYLYDSRTILLARILKDMSLKEKKFLYHFSLDIKKLLQEISVSQEISLTGSIERGKEAKKDNGNYTDSLFDRFKRGE